MFEQIKLDYDFSAMNPYIDPLTMETHYTKHHAAYTKNFNKAAKQAGCDGKTAEEIFIHLKAMEQTELTAALKNNGGGFYNHNLFFSTLKKGGEPRPAGSLDEQIRKTFKDFKRFQAEITGAAMGMFGSGWAWLSANAQGELRISASQNQSNPIMETAGVWTPILAVDVWEHAYYLKYKNLRLDYIQALFHVINWAKVEQLYIATQANPILQTETQEKEMQNE